MKLLLYRKSQTENPVETSRKAKKNVYIKSNIYSLKFSKKKYKLILYQT